LTLLTPILSTATESRIAIPKNRPPHPGEYVLEECIKPLCLTITEAAESPGVTRNTLSRLIHGRNGISPEMAVRLSMTFGSSPEMWLGLQNAYDLAQARISAGKIRDKRFATA
jgi:addiction module HigA family antidote